MIEQATRIAVVLGILSGAAPSARAGIVYSEAIDGELSGNNTSPTVLAFSEGVNTITGKMGASPSLDRDFFTITIAQGFQLTSIEVVSLSPTTRSFYAVGAGTSIDITNASGHLSNMLVNSTGEILDDLAAGPAFGGKGLSNPLGPGTYIFWFQETSTSVNYTMNYTLSAVPEPGTFTLCSAAGLWFAGWRTVRNRRKTP
jgi:hypothetical protein